MSRVETGTVELNGVAGLERDHAAVAGVNAARAGGYAPLRDYAAVGDGRTLALVARDGAIDWLSLSSVDSDPELAAILDVDHGGRLALQPRGDFSVTRRYLQDSNTLETTFETASGVLVVTDAATGESNASLPWAELVRAVRCVAGTVALDWTIEPRREPGGRPAVFEREQGIPVLRRGEQRLAVLAWGMGEPQLSTHELAGATTLVEGDEAHLALIDAGRGPLHVPRRDEVDRRLGAATECTRAWVGRTTYDGPWRDAVLRSALVLKLLTSASTGAIAAAATTSLPEQVGGDRNWDYRFAWIRDSSFALDALLRLGFREQVHDSISWLLATTARTHPRLNVLYTLDGGVPSACEELPLAGYRGSTPVRAGNSASAQLQLGCYGDLFETVWLYVKDGNVLDRGTASRLAEIADYVCLIWRQPDAGIWELPETRHYTISKIGCWVALDRALRLAERGSIPSHADRWRRERELVRSFVESRCWSRRRNAYAFHSETDDLDASVLLASRTGFADRCGERVASTIAAIREELCDGPFAYRYSGARRLEGAFLACSFWLVQALARAGRVDEATELMDELVGSANDVGLYTEEIDPRSGEMLGNVPQALTHLALIDAAGAVADARSKEEM